MRNVIAARHSPRTPRRPFELLIVLAGSGAIGFFFGLMQPAWTDAVLEPAQVLSGVVRYPVSTPVYVTHMKLWSVLNQIAALALYWGYSERTLALVLSGVVGMLSLQALAVFVLALSGSATWAVLSSFFLYFTGATHGGVTYPVVLLGASFTHGMFGLAYMLLAMALLGTGRVRAAAALLGFGPAVHLTLGTMCLSAAAIAVASDRRALGRFESVWPYLGAGLTAAMASAAIQLLPGGVDLGQTAAGLGASSSFTHFWAQDHRSPFPIFGGGMLLVWANVALLIAWSGPFRGDLPEHARLMLKSLIASACVGLVLSITYWLPPAYVPNVVYALMPSRLLNLNIMTSMALIVGVAWRHHEDVWIQATLTAVVVGGLAGSLVNGNAQAVRVGIGLGGPLLIVLVGLGRLGARPSVARSRMLAPLRRATVLAPAAVLLVMIPVAVMQFDSTMADSNDPVYEAAGGRSGLLLTAADVRTQQLHTRRPVLLDGGTLDNLPYAPEAVAQTDLILRRVYGVDTMHDVPQAPLGGLWPDAGRALWEARTTEEWRDIRREFGATDIVTPPGWQLRLPVITRSPDYMLYGIP